MDTLATKQNIVVSSAPPLIMASFINPPNIGQGKWSFAKIDGDGDTYLLTQDTCDQRHRHFISNRPGRDVSHTFLATPLADGTIQVRAITKLKFTPMYNIKPAVKPFAKGKRGRVAMGTWPGEDEPRHLTLIEDEEEDLLRDPERALDDDSMELDAVDAEECARAEDTFALRQSKTEDELEPDADDLALEARHAYLHVSDQERKEWDIVGGLKLEEERVNQEEERMRRVKCEARVSLKRQQQQERQHKRMAKARKTR
jgi:hypothetical protein